MTSTELSLFKELLKETVRVVVKEELDKFNDKLNESIKKANSKDLKEIKVLVGKQILESRKNYPSSLEERTLTEGMQSRLGQIFNKSMGHRSNAAPMGPLSQGISKSVDPANPLKSVLMETARSAEFDAGMLGVGELTEESLQEDLYPQPMQDYGEIEEYQPSNMPDFDPYSRINK